MVELLDLNVDCLLKIFSYCNENDLFNLCRTHWLLAEVIDTTIFQARSIDLLMCGHRNFPSVIERTQVPLSFANRLKIARNWLEGSYREQQYFHRSKTFAGKLLLERDWLYRSNNSFLSQHKRLRLEALESRPQHEIATNNKADIADFVKKKDTIFAGRATGACFIYEDEDGYATEQQLHNPQESMLCVDFANDMYVTSTDRSAKIWRRSEEFGLLLLDLDSELKSTFRTLSFNNDGNRIYGGLNRSTEQRALRETDLESGHEFVLNSNTICIHDLKVKDDHVIFTANSDTTLRLYDRRSDKDEFIWEDPFDSSFYCLDYDGLYAVVCGTKLHSRVNLYDIRVPGKHIHSYFPHFQRNQDSKSLTVYSIACDSRYLFVATDYNVHVLDFKIDTC